MKFKQLDIDGYTLFVSKSGVVKNIKGKILATRKDKDGYNILRLTLNGKLIYRRLHRVVALAFIPNKYNKPCVNHLNGVKSNNNVSNLEWCTHAENNKHMFKTGLRRIGLHYNVGSNQHKSKITTKDVINIRGSKMNRKELAEKYNMSVTNISYIITNKTWKHVSKGD